MAVGVLAWVREENAARRRQLGGASRRAAISASSASGASTGRLQVWPWHSIAKARGARQVDARRAVRPQAPVEAQHGQRRIGRAQRDRASVSRARIVERPVDHDRAAALQHVGAHQE